MRSPLPQLHREKDSKPSVPLDVLMHEAGMKEVKVPGLVHRSLIARTGQASLVTMRQSNRNRMV